jgi:hypothetical protein
MTIMKAMPPTLLLLAGLAGLAGVLGASEAIDKECLRYNDAVSKDQKIYDEALAKEKARSIAVIVPLARSRVRANDQSGAATAWQAVLSLDENNAEARKFFTASGTLDAVLAELKQDAAVDLLGNQVDGKPAPAAAPVPSAPAQPQGEPAPTPAATLPGTLVAISAAAPAGVPVASGKLKAGTAITFRYVDGSWARAAGQSGLGISPDDDNAPVPFRLRLTSDISRTDATLALIPSGTASSPFTFTLDSDCDTMVMIINAGPGVAQGTVHYRILVTAP